MAFSDKFTTDSVRAAWPPVLAGWNVRILLPVLLPVLLPTLLGAATYYASPSGADTNPGTYALPFRTVAGGIQAAGAG
ncbi:MAG TPA: hypothetical protein VKJ01_11215, partial [Candidatus Solibacter sp.]|nr:hypothetical protein [Candidatus Solibacter sp.]